MGSIRINISTALVVTFLVVVSALEPYGAAAEQVIIHKFQFFSQKKSSRRTDRKINVLDVESHFPMVEQKKKTCVWPARP